LISGSLRSEDFFEIAKFPTATFRSTKVEQGAGKETGGEEMTLAKTTRTPSFGI
jgi:polyisoprenoid-binding protein YceI